MKAKEMMEIDTADSHIPSARRRRFYDLKQKQNKNKGAFLS